MRDHVIAKERSDGKSSSLEEVWISPFGRNDEKEVEMTIGTLCKALVMEQ